MKIKEMKACKLCEFDHQHNSGTTTATTTTLTVSDKNGNGAVVSDKSSGKSDVVQSGGYCNHRHAAGTANTAAESLSPFNLLPPNLRDVFLAAQLLRGERPKDKV